MNDQLKDNIHHGIADRALAACPDTRFPLDIIDEMVYQVFC